MQIANIIYDSELVNHEKQSNINYLTGDDIYNYDESLPTLFVGWFFFKENFTLREKYSVDILNKTILENKIYWEFSFDENKSEHINGVMDFVLSAPILYFKENYEYVNINPIFDNIRTFEDLNKFNFHFDVFYNYKNEILYLLSANKICGVDLTFFSFFNFDNNKIIDFFKKKSDTIINDLDGSKLKKELFVFNNNNDLIKYLPVILTK